MRTTAYVLVSVACACHAYNIQHNMDDETDAVERLATVLLALNPSVSGGRSLSRSAVQMSTNPDALIKLGVIGFGRIGRQVVRIAMEFFDQWSVDGVLLSSTNLSWPEIFTLAGYFAISTIVQSMIGFGGGLILIPLAMRFVPLKDLLAVIMPPNQTTNVVMVMQSKQHIQYDVLLYRVLPWMGLGLILGMQLASIVTGSYLKRGLGFFVITAAVVKLYELLSTTYKSDAMKTPSAPVPVIPVFLAGVVHGIYGTGGPLLVYALGRANLSTNVFRATMSAMWVGITVLQAIGLFIKGSFSSTHVVLGTVMIIPSSIGLHIGTYVRGLLPERELRIFIYVMLLATGASLLR